MGRDELWESEEFPGTDDAALDGWFGLLEEYGILERGFEGYWWKLFCFFVGDVLC